MKKTGIMTDSHSGILNEEAERLGIKVLPMPFYIEEKVYREGVDLSRDAAQGNGCIYIAAVTGRGCGDVERNVERI